MASEDLGGRLDSVRVAGGFDAAVVDRFGAWLLGAPEEAVFRASPLRYAEEAGLAEQTAVDLFLHAVRAGVLDFTWGLTCPGCAGFIRTAVGLRGLAGSRHCPYCEVDVPGDLDALVEVAFTVAPSVRRLRFHDPETLASPADAMRLFFSSSIAEDDPVARPLLEGLLGAVRVPGGGRATLEADLAPGGHLMCAPALHAFTRMKVVPDGAETLDVDLLETGLAPRRLRARTGRVTLRLHNPGRRTVLVALGRDPVPAPEDRPPGMGPPQRRLRPYLTGKRLIATQRFRDLFRAESIPAEQGLELRSLTILFTDLTGSTALYGRVGDLGAFDLVRRHFELLREIVASEGGGIVKTIGDAVMASFAEPAPALRAAAAMNRAVGAVHDGEGALTLKIGLHQGPCIAVELNERLDYFGQTVNVAARVQGLAGPGEIVCTREAFAGAGVDGAADEAGLVPASEAARLKGVDGEVAVVRLTRRPGTPPEPHTAEAARTGARSARRTPAG